MTGKDRYAPFLRQLPYHNAPEQRQPRYPLSPTDSIVLGREPLCHIVLDPLLHRSVSRRHAEVSPVLGFNSPDGLRFWQVCDLDSANGTFVNGQRIKGCQVLQVGDRIMLGQDGPEFVFECEPVTPTAAKPFNKPVAPSTGKPSTKPVTKSGVKPAAEAPAEPPIHAGESPAFNHPPHLQKDIALPTIPSGRHPLPTTAPVRRKPVRTEADVSLTQLFPIFSTGHHLTRKAYLLPGIITVVVVISLFLAVGDARLFNLLLAVYLTGAAFYFIYQLCGKHKPWWLLVSVAVMTILLLISPVLGAFIYVFRNILPGDLAANNAATSFPELLMRMFFGAGLMEELLKAVPVLVVCVFSARLRSPLREDVGVREPLDGILLGSAAAVGFTLVETLGQYVPEIYKATLAAGEGAAQLASLQLLIPRVLGSVAGHMAYSGYLGYFIGLSVLRPRRRWRILAVGYLSAAALHALWNVTGTISPALLAVVGVMSYAFLGAAILKARELSPTRSQNFATRFYQ